MKKNTLDKQLIKALAIGISASMAMQPVTAFAADEGVVNDPATVDGDGTTETILEAKETDIVGGIADLAQDAAGDLSSSIEIAEKESQKAAEGIINGREAVEATDETLAEEAIAGATIGEAGSKDIIENDEVKTVDLSGEVIDAANDVATDDNFDKASTDIDNAKKDLIIAENENENEDSAVKETVAVIEDTEKLAKDVETTINDAIENATTLGEAIQNASSVDEATKKMEQLQTLASDTQEALDNYNANLKELNDKFDQAIGKLNDAQAKYDQAVNGKDGVLHDVSSARSELEAAERNVENLENAISRAIKGIEKENAAALEIINAQENENASGSNDVLFNTLMKNYYMPKMLGGDASDIAVEKNNNGYFTVSYKENDKDKKKYYSYSLSNGNIVFFEESEEEVAAIEYLAAYNKKYIDEHNELTEEERKELESQKVYSYSANENGTTVTRYMTEKELIAGVNANNIVVVNGNHYLKNGNGTLTTIISDVDAPTEADKNNLIANDANSQYKSVSVSNSTRDEFVIENGKLFKYTYSDVTEKTFKRYTYTSEYKKSGYTETEKNNIVSQLGDKVSFVKVTDVASDETYYQLTGSYVPVFTITVNKKDINEYVKNEEEAKKKFIERIKALGFTVTTTSTELKSERKWDIVPLDEEEYYVWGNVNYNGSSIEVRNANEYTSFDEAKKALENSINLADDGANGNATVSTIESIGEWKWKKVLLVSLPYFDFWGEKYRNQSFDASESYKDFTVTAGQDGYKHYAACVDYLKEIASNSGEKAISKVEYEAAVMAIEVIQDTLKETTSVNVGTDKDLENILESAKSILERYNRYASEAKKAHDAIDTAQDNLDTLNESITTLNNAHSVKTAYSVLNVGDLAEYFGMEVSDEEKKQLNEMSIDDFKAVLKALKNSAEKKKTAAENRLNELNEKVEQAGIDFEKTIERLTPPAPIEKNEQTNPSSGSTETDNLGNESAGTGSVVIPSTESSANAGTTNDNREGTNSQNETDSEAFTEDEGSSVITAVVTTEVAAPASADGAVTVSSLVAADGAQVLGAKRVATTSDTAKTTTKVATDTKKDANKTSGNKASKSENKAVGTNEALTDNTASESDKEAVVAESETKNTEEKTAQGEAVTIVDEESAKAAAPAEKQASFPWWIIAILAAAAGISVEEYARRKNIKVKANNKDSFNK